MFKSVETSLTNFQDHISKINVQPTSTINDEQLSQAVSLIESCLKSLFAPIFGFGASITQECSMTDAHVSNGR